MALDPRSPEAAPAPELAAWPLGLRGAPELHTILPGVSSAALAEAIAVETSDMVAALDHEMRFVAVNPSVEQLTGWRPDELLGRNGLELLHPDDIERGEFIGQLAAQRTAPGGSATFRMRTAAGDYLPCQVAGGIIELDGHLIISMIARVNFVSDAVDGILDGLLHSRSRREVFAAIAEYIAWRENGSHVAFSWSEHGELHTWSTGVPASLSGIDDHPSSLWHRCRSSGVPTQSTDLAPLTDDQRRLATDHNLTGVWVVPVDDPSCEVPALVTIWTTNPVLEPRNHALGMTTATRYVELALRWFAQTEALAAAANHDDLTGLANRRAFYAAIEQPDGDAPGPAGGAVLYCDLDGFKPVNDAHGHAVGDAVLRVTAARLRAAVRDRDLVARLGGDEFAVVLWGADENEAATVADRLRASFATPIDVSGLTVAVGITVGIAHDAEGIDERLVEAADRALYLHKRRKERGSDSA